MNQLALDNARRESMREFERELDVKILSAAGPWSESKQEFAEAVGGEVWTDPLRRPGLVIVVARNTPSCDYPDNATALKALIEASPEGAIRKSGADAFGTNPNVNGWNELVISNKHFTDVTIVARKLGIKLYDPSCGSTYGTIRQINIEQQKEDLAALQARLGDRMNEYIYRAKPRACKP